MEERSSVGNRSKGWNYYIDHYIPKFDEKIISSKELNKKNSNPNYNVFNNLKQKSQKTTAPNETPKIMSKNNNNTNGQKNEVSPQVSKEELSKQLIQALKPDGNSQKLIELETQNSKIENNIILKKKMSSQAEAFIPNLSEPKE